MQENSKYRLCSDRDERVNHMINEYNKLAQKEYKKRLNRKIDPLEIVQKK